MVKIDSKILLLLRNKLDLEYDLESLLEKKFKTNENKIEFTKQLIEEMKTDYDENKINKINKKQNIIFIQFIQKLYILLNYFQEIEKTTVNINEILSKVNIDLVLNYQCIDKNLNINFDNYTWF